MSFPPAALHAQLRDSEYPPLILKGHILCNPLIPFFHTDPYAFLAAFTTCS